VNAKTRWVLSVLAGSADPPRNEKGRFAPRDGEDGERRPVRADDYDGGVRPMPPRPADPLRAHAELVLALARPRSVGPFVG
jgi:hypothetical protein